MRELFWGLYDVWEVVKDMIWQISIVILIVMACRLFVGKISKQASYLLWLIVAVRLLCPVMIPSDFSVFNVLGESRFTEIEIASSDSTISESAGIVNEYITPELPMQDFANAGQAPVADEEATVGNFTQGTVKPVIPNDNHNNIIYSDILKANFDFIVWLAGMTFMFAYGFLSYYRLKYKLRFATKAGDDIFESNAISSPFVFGVIKPVIYLPYHLNGQEKSYILQHEKYHIKRRDYLVKLFAFGLLAVYWFHPLVWAAFYLMSRDMEMSCDEQVLKELGMEERKAYSTLLLSFAGSKRFPLPSPLSFGENDVKNRIKGILYYKKPTFWGVVAVIALVVVLAVSCLTDASDNSDKNETDAGGTYENADEAEWQFAETLFEIKNPYIGDMPANGKILTVIFEELGITGFNGSELQTYTEPYWITVGFNEKPDDTAMWQASAMFLALVDNATEVRWSFYDESEDLNTYYVTVDSVNEYMEGENLKNYTSSIEKIVELWKLLDEKKFYAAATSEDDTSILISTSNWDDKAMEAGLDFTERIAWENRLIADGIGYRGDDGIVRNCVYEDFDRNGMKDLIVIIRDTNWEDSIDDKFCIYMNNDPVYVRELEFMGASWDVTSADLDNDGYVELLFSGDSGGTGGYGFNAIFDLLKYKNNTFEAMPLPLDDFVESEEETAGFGVEVYTAEGEGNYVAYCPALNESISFSIGSLKSDFFDTDTPANTLVGRECYGFNELTPVLQNGKTYLLAVESIYRINIYARMQSIGTANFLLSWDENTGWFVEKFDVVPYDYDGVSDDDMNATGE